MSKIKLDKSRYHSEVHGEAQHGLAAFQDGLPFNHQGELIQVMITPDLQVIVDKKLRKIAKLQAASAPASTPQTPPPPPPAASDDKDGDDQNAADDDDEDDGDVSDEVNFEQWLKDEVKYPWHLIAGAAKKRFSKHFKNAKELAEFLVYDENLVGPEDVPTKLGPKGT